MHNQDTIHSDTIQFYRYTGKVHAEAGRNDAEISLSWWRPSLLSWRPPEVPWHPFVSWSLFARLGLFKNNAYSVVSLKVKGKIVHRSCVLPAFYRFPFMASCDIQIAATWTDPEFRGRGLARNCANAIIRMHCPNRSAIWYIVSSDNLASIKVAESCGFTLVGQGRRTKPLAISALGRFVVDKWQGGTLVF